MSAKFDHFLSLHNYDSFYYVLQRNFQNYMNRFMDAISENIIPMFNRSLINICEVWLFSLRRDFFFPIFFLLVVYNFDLWRCHKSIYYHHLKLITLIFDMRLSHVYIYNFSFCIIKAVLSRKCLNGKGILWGFFCQGRVENSLIEVRSKLIMLVVVLIVNCFCVLVFASNISEVPFLCAIAVYTCLHPLK